MFPELVDMYDMKNVIKAYESMYQNDRRGVERYHI